LKKVIIVDDVVRWAWS